jgi:ATP-binding cassette subfamily B protein
LNSLYQRFGVIFQDYARYQFSVRENIGFGQIDEVDNLEKVREAAERGGADKLVEELPDGYETILGRRWEKGQELSGGQWQKNRAGARVHARRGSDDSGRANLRPGRGSGV